MARKLNIKDLVPRKKGPYRQGYYNLLNPEKYMGDPNKIIFRSSYERKFATYCDTSPTIVKWSSEPLQIPYLHPVEQVTKPYNVDFYIKLQKEEYFQEFLVEVKPQRKLKKPDVPKSNASAKRMQAYVDQMKEYLTNLAKFNAARNYCHGRGWQFIVVTETFLSL